MSRFLALAGALALLLPARAGITPSQPQLDQKNCELAAYYSRTHDGDALRIEQAGHLVYENYAPGWNSGTARKIYSGTKSYVAVTAMILVQKGLLHLDEKASDTLTEWKKDGRRAITIDELLSQTSGLKPDDNLIYDSHDQLAGAVRVPLAYTPGTRFHYCAANYQAFGEILRRKFPHYRSVEDIFMKLLLDPADLDVDYWVRDDAGNVLIHSGMMMNVKEWARFGLYLLNDGQKPGFAPLFRGHTANPAYGLGFWLNAPQPADRIQSIKDLQPACDGDQIYPGGPRDIIAAMGTDKQRLYVIPSQQLVIVRFAHGGRFSDSNFLSLLLTGKPHPDKHTH